MSSDINPGNVNEGFPVPGRDNNSQGFRDNFNAIKTNFTYTKREIDDLMNKVVVKSQLTYGPTIDNNLNGQTVTGITLRKEAYALVSNSEAATVVIDYSAGSQQEVVIGTTSGNTVTLSFTNFPADNSFAELRLFVTVSSSSLPVYLAMPNAEFVNTAGLFGWSPAKNIKFTAAGEYIFVLGTRDSGTTFSIYEETFRGLALIGNVSATTFIGNLTGNSTGIHTGSVIGNVTGNVTGNLTGDVYASNGTKILENGSGSNATFTGNVTGNVVGNVVGNLTGNVVGNLTGNIDSITRISDVLITSVTNGQVLKYDATTGKWINAADQSGTGGAITLSSLTVSRVGTTNANTGNLSYNDGTGVFTFTAPAPTLDSLTNVDVPTPTNGQILKYNSSNSTWFASSPSATTTNIADLGDVAISSPTPNEVLIYDATSSQWINGPVSTVANNLSLGQLADVSLDTLTCCDQLKYDCDQEAWVNYKPGGYTEFDVKIVDDGYGQEVFELNGTKIKTSTGILYSGLEFKVGGVYRFKLDHISNADGPLRFSTTNDYTVNPDYPASDPAPTITPYTTGVKIVGEAGQPGSYVELCVDSSAPKFLYLYADEAVEGSGHAMDTSKVGGMLPIPVTDRLVTLQTNVAVLAHAGASNLSIGTEHFSTTPSKTATLAAGVEGLIKTYCHNLQPALTAVTITGTTGTFTCSATTLEVGQQITISGSAGGTGSISGYTTGTSYYIIAINGTTAFTLSATPGGAPITTTAGTPTGLTYTPVIGTMVITVTNAGWKGSGTGTITFDAAGDACTVQYVNSKWFCIGNNGAVFA